VATGIAPGYWLHQIEHCRAAPGACQQRRVTAFLLFSRSAANAPGSLLLSQVVAIRPSVRCPLDVRDAELVDGR
jgi:hypothetical protein